MIKSTSPQNVVRLFLGVILLFYTFAILWDFITIANGSFIFYEAVRLKGYILPARWSVYLIEFPFRLGFSLFAKDISSLKTLYEINYYGVQLLFLTFILYNKKAKQQRSLLLAHFILVITLTQPSSGRIPTYFTFMALPYIENKLFKIVFQIFTVFLHPFSAFFLLLNAYLNFREDKFSFKSMSAITPLFIGITSFFIHFILFKNYNKTSVGIDHLSNLPELIPFYLFFAFTLLSSNHFIKKYAINILVILILSIIITYIEGRISFDENAYSLKYILLAISLIFYRWIRVDYRPTHNFSFCLVFIIILNTSYFLFLVHKRYNLFESLKENFVTSKSSCLNEMKLAQEVPNFNLLYNDPCLILGYYLHQKSLQHFIDFKDQELHCTNFKKNTKYSFDKIYPFSKDLNILPTPYLFFQH